jgi:hypothetical protein
MRKHLRRLQLDWPADVLAASHERKEPDAISVTLDAGELAVKPSANSLIERTMRSFGEQATWLLEQASQGRANGPAE